MITRIKKSIGFRTSHWYQEMTLSDQRDAVRSFFKRKEEIHTFTSQDELLLLAKYSASVPTGSSIVEIGSYLGASTRYLLHGSREARPNIVCIDTWMNETMPAGIQDTWSEFKANLDPHMDRIQVIRGNSKQVNPTNLPDSIGLAFIDGDHSYESVKHDLSLVLPKITRGSYIAFHDIAAFQGVSRCVGEHLSLGTYRIEAHINNLIIIKNDQFEK